MSLKSKCILAYTSLYADPDGTIKPCCIAKPFKDNLNWNDYDTIEGLYNSPQMRGVRESMENGVAPSTCDICFKHGNTLKDNWNRMWKDKFDDPKLINDDYSINTLQYLDMRFSNLCNLKCRMCGPSLSSTWHEDLVEIYGHGYSQHNTKFINIGKTPVDKFTDKDLAHIEHLYLAGGEPFISQEVYNLLDRFTVEQMSKITMYINTNLSTISYKGRNILETLKYFKSVNIGCSCDGYGEIGEFQRTGFKSDRFFKNLIQLTDFAKDNPTLNPEIEFSITLMNIFHIFDFIEFITSNNYLPESNIHFHWATTPYWYAPAAAPLDFKEKIYTYIEEGLKKRDYHPHIVEVLNTFVEATKVPASIIMENQEIKDDLKEYMGKLDKIRGNSYKDICPWIEMMFPENMTIKTEI